MPAAKPKESPFEAMMRRVLERKPGEPIRTTKAEWQKVLDDPLCVGDERHRLEHLASDLDIQITDR